jgi:mono/diheme cytochrome c family protein/glucose/arabinose dehydrogenase
MKSLKILAILAVLGSASESVSAADIIRVLIIDGRNNHDWRETTDSLRATLGAAGRFEVKVSTAPRERFHSFPSTPPKSADPVAFAEAKQRHEIGKRAVESALKTEWESWNPDFEAHDVVLLNYNGPDWPERVRRNFVKFVRQGGGLLLIHAANNGFRDWPEFNEMIGLGYNGARGISEGRKILSSKIEDATGRLLTCCEGQNSGHGSQHAFLVKVRAPDHPIMSGLPSVWRHGRDELYHNLRGVGRNLTILSSAYSDPKQRGTGHHEPVTWAVEYGKGRVIVTTMGHHWPRQVERDSLECVGFQTVVARSLEFAARGKVTLMPPTEFPGVDEPVLRKPHRVGWSTVSADGIAKTNWRARKDSNPFVLLTPEEERESFQLPAGFFAELVAAEPMIEEPVVAVHDISGAMYVAEMRSYMQDENGGGTKTLKNGRVKRLVDLDGDGRMDRATVFVDGLNLPRMLLPLDDRLAVVETDSSHVWSYRDTDGDGVADEKKLLFKGREGSPTRSVEHQDSGLIWNLDNWIYISYNHERYRYTDGEWRAEKVPNHWAQWGLAQDDVGRLFFTDNSKPVLNLQIPRTYWANVIRRTGRMPRFTPSVGLAYEHGFLDAQNLCPIDDRGGKAPATKRFTSICGQTVFRGDGLPDDVYGDYFFCDPTIHVVRRAEIGNRNGQIRLKRVGTNEFMISPDINFRPVNTHTGPDGCLYVTDMYRGIIQDAPWLNPDARRFVREAGLSRNILNGRIWRIRHRDHQPSARPGFQDEETVALIRHFENPNGWWRDTAQRLILLRPDRELAAPLLEDFLRYDLHDPIKRLHCLWTLEGMDKAGRDLLLATLKDRDPRLRAAAIRIGEAFIRENDADFIAALAPLARERESELLKQLILSLGWSDEQAALDIIAEVVRGNLDDDAVYLAAMASLWGGRSPVIDEIRDGSIFRSIRDEEERAPLLKRWIAGLAAWERKDIQLPKDYTSRQRWLVGHGETIFFETCSSCHGPNGDGQEVPGTERRLAPPLRNSPRVLGDPAKLVRILLHGLTGPVDGRTYEAGAMPTLASLGYDDPNRVTQILNFIRHAWDHKLPPIEVDEIKRVIEETKARQTPWTLEELARN